MHMQQKYGNLFLIVALALGFFLSLHDPQYYQSISLAHSYINIMFAMISWEFIYFFRFMKSKRSKQSYNIGENIMTATNPMYLGDKPIFTQTLDGDSIENERT